MNPLLQPKRTTLPLAIGLALACFALSPSTQAVVPPPDGGYPGGNTAEGQNALLSLTTGGFNTAVGYLSLSVDSTGSFNTANGAGALLSNTADENTATGTGALLTNTVGDSNTADGAFALFSNTSGVENTVVGDQSLFNNTSGIANNAIGVHALFSNTTGNFNTAIGRQALSNSTTGNGNIALGDFAGANVFTAGDVICIGSNVQGDNVSGSCFIGNIFSATSSGGTAVFVNASGRLGTTTSSRRFKEQINPMDRASEALFALKPVTFRYRQEIDPERMSQFGLVAEDVEKINPNLVVRDKEGKPYSVRYDQVNAMLLNEFLKEHKKTQKLETTVASLIATVKEQAMQIQKVSAQLAAASPSRGGLEASKFAIGRIRGGGPATQVVNNP